METFSKRVFDAKIRQKKITQKERENKIKGRMYRMQEKTKKTDKSRNIKYKEELEINKPIQMFKCSNVSCSTHRFTIHMVGKTTRKGGSSSIVKNS